MGYSIPDPERASNNIETFLAENPGDAVRLEEHRGAIAMLFSHSQFLANHSVRNPDALFGALETLHTVPEADTLREELRDLLAHCGTIAEGMKAVRMFRKNKMLHSTLRDILRKAEFQEILLGLSALADVVLDESLSFVEGFLVQRYGTPAENVFAVIAMGKLGAEELNYSSDVDIVYVYREEGETSGISTLPGVVRNRISAFEFYVKLAEELTRFLSVPTEDGFAYRVDLRLRPQGQRGSMALSLAGYEEYYESWGQLWERAAALRARPVAGDAKLGKDFLDSIRPFVYRKYLDFQAIEEIRRMKGQVEQIKPGTQSRDIKRGYGGIREIEFFIQVFQLIYGGKDPALRERSTFKALHRLVQKGFIGHEDLRHLADNYLFLRTLEHRLQQVNDLQVHSLPSGERELDILGKKMGFAGREDFLAELDARRRRVRDIYDSLLFIREGKGEMGGSRLLGNEYWDMDTPAENLLVEELAKAGVNDTHKAVYCLMKIRNNMHSFQTIRGRRLLEEVMPGFVEEALKGPNPDLSLLHLVDFSGILAAKEYYLDAISRRREIVSLLTFILSQSEYLSKILMSNPEYIESLVEGERGKKSLRTLREELGFLVEKRGEATAIRLFRRMEEIRLGVRFLDGRMEIARLVKVLSKVAEAVLTRMVRPSSPSSLAVVGFGKLGGREITFNSDLDIIFVTKDEPSEDEVKAAERLLKAFMSYTKDGIAYRVDTRLRPEGNKGPLVSSLKGLGAYYRDNAQPWEIQALLKARPVAGAACTATLFLSMRNKVLRERGEEVTLAEVQKMRDRIQRELSKEGRSGREFDIKLGAGGLEELEFAVQYLQLRQCRSRPEFLVQGTLDALGRLMKKGVLEAAGAAMLRETYLFYRTIETVLRLRNESVLSERGNALQTLAGSRGISAAVFLDLLQESKERVSVFWNSLRP
ncbi:MAG: bifunctional [glutamate--ammonia ligase]-adenylyl-L-tyrosine phosphorylase/[glutamate--ammonia-ligase] adenylyltransferase [Alphaproteobacteria bacterium]|uniref:Bifunctional [glutamate--ammonia ligase]-adenylyl-L-tyrosine phosphorylase/[glutamate--ammonia-ligase] adenylyltransferase n=1 Tax=Candidatus Nitrobium versatile TaxID=2884831 RepID=A0A953JC63_9BACT|nr:bifunctional [glutamate--ammonia ligase]-adenylyl-L-tyrosine phosphorylase/[glutamate--ammonia-ligase] adenylyltransferase [Candidatus Nitrobium versatile]